MLGFTPSNTICTSSKNTNILHTLSHWNTYYQEEEKQMGYHHGQFGIDSMSPRDIRGKRGVVPGGNSCSSGSCGAVKTKPTTSFTTKHDVVLMTLTLTGSIVMVYRRKEEKEKHHRLRMMMMMMMYLLRSCSNLLLTLLRIHYGVTCVCMVYGGRTTAATAARR
jgi:hypothetical protein